VQTSITQTALWVGNVVTYTVNLVCRPGVNVLQEDLAADRLSLQGLQVVGHTLRREVSAEGETRYTAAYRLTTFEPGTETVGIGDWVVRYAIGSAQGGSAPAQELRIPGAALAWRSALPAALATLDIRGGRAPAAPPWWWQHTRAAAMALVAVSVSALGGLLDPRVTLGRPRKAKRRAGREAARDLRSTFAALRDADVTSPAERLAAYAALETAVRRHAAESTALPVAALTPDELRARLAAYPASFSGDEIRRILDECQRARYQPAERLPDPQQFHSTLESATLLFPDAR